MKKLILAALLTSCRHDPYKIKGLDCPTNRNECYPIYEDHSNTHEVTQDGAKGKVG